jgi:hypothetical protein
VTGDDDIEVVLADILAPGPPAKTPGGRRRGNRRKAEHREDLDLLLNDILGPADPVDVGPVTRPKKSRPTKG